MCIYIYYLYYLYSPVHLTSHHLTSVFIFLITLIFDVSLCGHSGAFDNIGNIVPYRVNIELNILFKRNTGRFRFFVLCAKLNQPTNQSEWDYMTPEGGTFAGFLLI